MSRYCLTMQIARSGRFVFVAQWFLAALLPVFFFLGRGFIGAEVGWVGIIGLVYGIIVIFVLLVPPLLTLFDGEVRKAKATRAGYDLATALLWGALLFGALTVPDSGDSGHLNSALTTWTNGAISYETSAAIFYGAAVVMGLAYLAAFVTATMGIVRSRRAGVSSPIA